MHAPLLRVRTSALLAALVLSVAAIPATLAGTPFSKIVVFGDSLNDRGNMLQFTQGAFPAPPTYTLGRQSNGQLWVEYLAGRLGMSDKILNYAVVGAMTKPAPGFPTGNVWSDTYGGLQGTDVASQVLDYLGDFQGRADPAALFILEGGANDFPRVANPAVIVGNLIESLVTLQAAGAKHIVVMLMPDIGKTPRALMAEAAGLIPPGSAAFYSAVCQQLNQALLAALPTYTYPGVTLTIADTWTFMNRVAANPASYGLTDVQRPFLLFGGTGDQSKWLFWDDLHPTTRGHQIFSEQVVESLVRSYSPGQGKVGNGAINSLNGLLHSPRR
ncbi:MAG: SGNH/GDSL hydrolase family protein [Verrucomicrobia bacterium]|nr:SGNH/GDSL hydrolase family protein [Verrucomicrobiota bacterium]